VAVNIGTSDIRTTKNMKYQSRREIERLQVFTNTLRKDEGHGSVNAESVKHIRTETDVTNENLPNVSIVVF
jgi:hypothetical protein